MTQDPDDEPASVLLERIQLERKAQQAQTKQPTQKVQKRGQAKTPKAAPQVQQEQAAPIDVESIVQPDLWQSIEAGI